MELVEDECSFGAGGGGIGGGLHLGGGSCRGGGNRNSFHSGDSSHPTRLIPFERPLPSKKSFGPGAALFGGGGGGVFRRALAFFSDGGFPGLKIIVVLTEMSTLRYFERPSKIKTYEAVPEVTVLVVVDVLLACYHRLEAFLKTRIRLTLSLW